MSESNHSTAALDQPERKEDESVDQEITVSPEALRYDQAVCDIIKQAMSQTASCPKTQDDA